MIDTPRLTLRKPVAHDLPHVGEFYATERSQYVGGPLDLGGAWRGFAMMLGHWAIHGFGLFTAVRKGADIPIGMIGPWVPGDWPDNEIGWHIWRPEDEGHGFATEAGRAVLDHMRSAHGWTRVVSYIAHGNDASVRVAERLGATLSDLPHPPGKPCLVYEHAGGAA
ncbi:MAG: GNAT family N-acetyltransferase [Shimia sp.]